MPWLVLAMASGFPPIAGVLTAFLGAVITIANGKPDRTHLAPKGQAIMGELVASLLSQAVPERSACLAPSAKRWQLRTPGSLPSTGGDTRIGVTGNVFGIPRKKLLCGSNGIRS